MTEDKVTYSRYGADHARAVYATQILPLYAAVWADDIETDPFASAEQFTARWEGDTRSPGFELVIATDGTGRPVGAAFGHTLQPGSGWWEGLEVEVPDEFVAEDGARTFAGTEILVLEDYRRRGIATGLARTLIAGRPERRATVLVDPEHAEAHAAFESWGMQEVGLLRPSPDAPDHVSMVIDLPLDPVSASR